MCDTLLKWDHPGSEQCYTLVLLHSPLPYMWGKITVGRFNKYYGLSDRAMDHRPIVHMRMVRRLVRRPVFVHSRMVLCPVRQSELIETAT